MSGPWARAIRKARAVADRLSRPVLSVLVRTLARDTTSRIVEGALLVFAPHPDDETLACGATVARAVATGAEVTIVIATDGRASHDTPAPEALALRRRVESDDAASALGVDRAHVVHWGYVDGCLEDGEDALTDDVSAIVRSRRWHVVLAPSPRDPHSDHRALGRAVHKESARSGTPLVAYWVWGWMHPTDLVGRPPAGRARTDGARRRSRWWPPMDWCRTLSAARPVVVRAEGFKEAKRQALSCHRSQFGPSASEAGFPPGNGPLTGKFLTYFAGHDEVFFPVVGRGFA